MDFLGLPIILFLIGALLFYAVRILREYERGVIFQLGRFCPTVQPA